MVKRRKLVKFNAIKTIKRPVKVSFKTKSGKRVSFKATKVVRRKKPIRFYARR